MNSLRFAGEYPPALVIGFALVAAVAVAWYYLRETKSVEPPYCYLLPGLRGAAVALVILILAGPVWHRRQIIGTLGRVVFAIDTSESMALSDSGQPESSPQRLQRAAELLTGNATRDGWLESLQQTHEVDVIAFSSGEPTLIWSSASEQPVPTALELVADGERTDMSAPLASMLSSLNISVPDAEPAEGDSGQRAALVLLSDGRDNTGPSPVDVAQQLESAGVRLHAVGMGSEDEPPDVGIVNVVRPDSVAADGTLAGQLMLEAIWSCRPAIACADRIGWSNRLAKDNQRIRCGTTNHSIRIGGRAARRSRCGSKARVGFNEVPKCWICVQRSNLSAAITLMPTTRCRFASRHRHATGDCWCWTVPAAGKPGISETCLNATRLGKSTRFYSVPEPTW